MWRPSVFLAITLLVTFNIISFKVNGETDGELHNRAKSKIRCKNCLNIRLPAAGDIYANVKDRKKEIHQIKSSNSSSSNSSTGTAVSPFPKNVMTTSNFLNQNKILQKDKQQFVPRNQSFTGSKDPKDGKVADLKCNSCLNFELPTKKDPKDGKVANLRKEDKNKTGRDIKGNLTKSTIEETKKVPKKE